MFQFYKHEKDGGYFLHNPISMLLGYDEDYKELPEVDGIFNMKYVSTVFLLPFCLPMNFRLFLAICQLPSSELRGKEIKPFDSPSSSMLRKFLLYLYLNTFMFCY